MSGKTINDLNDDCLREIFSRLTLAQKLKCESVCKRWRCISQSGWNIKTLHLPAPVNKRPGTRVILQRCGGFLRKIEINLGIHGKDGPQGLQVIQSILDNCSQLREIDITLIDSPGVFAFFVEPLRVVFSSLEQLKEVKISAPLPDSRERFEYLLHTLPIDKLQSLSIDNSAASEPAYLSVSRFTNLRSLAFQGVTVPTGFWADLESLQYLRSFSLNYCSATEDSFNQIHRLANLEELTLTNLPDLRDHHICQILRHCRKLKHLDVAHHADLTNNSRHAIVEHANLDILCFRHLGGVSDNFIRNLYQIGTLTLIECSGFTIEGLKDLIRQSRKLRQLTITASPDMPMLAAAVNDAILERQSSERFTLQLM